MSEPVWFMVATVVLFYSKYYSNFPNEFKPDAVRSKDRKVERNEVT